MKFNKSYLYLTYKFAILCKIECNSIRTCDKLFLKEEENFMTNEDFAKVIAVIFNPELRHWDIVKDYDKAKNVNSKLCAECGGTCCKRCGCEFSPDDFADISFEALKREIEKGYISIEYIDGEIILEDRGVYILRARNAQMPIVDLGYKRGTGCILLTEKGCKLDYGHRPSGGKLLIPSNEIISVWGENHRECNSSYGIEECCYEWKPYQKIIMQLIDYFKDKDFPCSI